MNEPTEYDINHSPGSISPLPPVLHHGLAAVATFGLLSFLTSLALIALLIYKLISWQIRPTQSKNDIPERPESPPSFDHNGFLVPARGASPAPWEDSAPEEPETFLERLKREPPNQFLVLILNLFLADMQQALAFLLNLDWVVRDAIQVGTPTCWLQGFFISNGDLASSIFITGIAAHTYLGVVMGYRVPTAAFYWAIGGLWGFVYMCGFLAIIIANSRPEFGGPFVRAGAWCWWHPVHQDLRLYLHYLWIFISLAATSVLYILIFFHLRDLKKNGGRPRASAQTSLSDSISTRSLSRSSSRAKHYPNPDPNSYPIAPGSPTTSFASSLNKDLPPIPDSARQQTFLLYPLIYLVCTVPLAAGRIASMAGNEVSVGYFCFAGAAIACNGLLDAVLYTYTRRAIVFSDERPGQDTGIDTFAFMRTPPSRKFGNVVIVSGGQANNGVKRRGRWRGAGERAAGSLGLGMSKLKGGMMGGANASEESFRGFGMGQGEVLGMAIQCETTTTVSVEYDDGARGRTIA